MRLIDADALLEEYEAYEPSKEEEEAFIEIVKIINKWASGWKKQK